MLEIIKASLWNSGEYLAVDWDTYAEMRMHTISMLPAAILANLTMSESLRETWKQDIIQSITNNFQCEYIQSNIPITVPYAILKGTTAAQYYPHPEYRLQGDIDIITKHEDFQLACDELLNNGYEESFSHPEEAELGRHRAFIRDNIVVELHSFFAMLNNPRKAEYLDNMIISNINPSHVLPDPVNGLVLLEHINQHLESGLGLRQVIDWMMFVDKCLPDGKWLEFQDLAKNSGLEKLAITTTRMCELFLGLPAREWSAKADESLCGQLMEYILSCGNFGNKRKSDSDIGQRVFSRARTPKAVFKLLQERGMVNWRAVEKHPILRPFAWVYQAGRYLMRGFGRDEASTKLRAEYKAANQRNIMFDALGVQQTAKGLAVFRNGKYKKK